MSESVTAHPLRRRLFLVCLGVFVTALTIRWVYALLLPVRISADAAYYMAVAGNLHHGRGMVVDYVWQYLPGVPAALPIPSNGYWMPATSWVIAAAYAVAGSTSERAAQAPSLLFGAVLCALAAWFAGALFARWEAALLAGALAAVSFHLVGVSLYPDHFGLAGTLVNLSLLALWAAWWRDADAATGRKRWVLTALSGAVAGLATLTRNDGVLLLAVAALPAAALLRRRQAKRAAWMLASYMGPFALVVVPWLVRQQFVFGTPWGDRPLRTAFLTNYNDLFRVDLSQLTLAGLLHGGVYPAVSVRGYALYRDLRLLLKAVGVAALLAVATLANAQLRRRAAPWLVFLAAGLLVPAFLVPYPTRKGGFWHLMPALCPILFALGAGACVRLLDWSRGRAGQLAPALGRLAVFFAFVSLLPWWVVAAREVGHKQPAPYPAVARLAVQAVGRPQVVLTDDVWGLHYVTGAACAQYPSDGPQAALVVADRLGARYLITRENPPGGPSTVTDPQAILANPRFQALWRYRSGEGNVLVYRILEAPPAK